MLHDAKAVANYLIKRSVDDGIPFSALKLQKMVYFCHAWTLALCKYPLIYQPIMAWEYGPIIRDLFEVVSDMNNCSNELVTTRIKFVVPVEFNDDEKKIVDRVYDQYSPCTTNTLCAIAHAPTTPWAIVNKAVSGEVVISDTLIEQHYTKKGEENVKEDEEANNEQVDTTDESVKDRDNWNWHPLSG